MYFEVLSITVTDLANLIRVCKLSLWVMDPPAISTDAPLLLVYEEAHAHCPTATWRGSAPQKLSIERIVS